MDLHAFSGLILRANLRVPLAHFPCEKVKYSPGEKVGFHLQDHVTLKLILIQKPSVSGSVVLSLVVHVER